MTALDTYVEQSLRERPYISPVRRSSCTRRLRVPSALRYSRNVSISALSAAVCCLRLG